MKIIIDSSILIDYFREGQKWQEFLENAPRDAKLFIPTIVIFEIFSGKSSKKNSNTKNILALLKKFTQVDLTDTVAMRAGELYRDIGSHIDAGDYIIAASALEIGATVLTLNTKHFQQIPGVTLYPI